VALRQKLKQWVGPHGTVLLRCLTRGMKIPRWGNIRKNAPFSTYFGFERGTPLDRYYLYKFLEEHRSLIKGKVLEIQNNSLTRKFGENLSVEHSLDIVGEFSPTYLCDLSELPSSVPRGNYDCFLMPNTFQVIRRLEPALRNAYELIKPGGVILASAAGFLPLVPDTTEYWRFTRAGWEELLPTVWPGAEIEVRAHGNSLAAVASMLGLAHEELKPAELDVVDERYPVLITIHCRKPKVE
jgi:hypothetical protein